MKNDRHFKHFLNENIILKQHVDEHFVFFQASPAHVETLLFSSQGSVTRCKTPSTRNVPMLAPNLSLRKIVGLEYLFLIFTSDIIYGLQFPFSFIVV